MAKYKNSDGTGQGERGLLTAVTYKVVGCYGNSGMFVKLARVHERTITHVNEVSGEW